MLPEKADLDMVDVDLTPTEAFVLTDDDHEPDIPDAAAAEDDKPTDDKPTADPDKHESRYTKRVNLLLWERHEAEERAAAAETALEIERQKKSAENEDGADDEFAKHLEAINQQIEEESDDPAMASVLKTQRLLMQREQQRAEDARKKPDVKEQPQQPQDNAPHPSASKWLESNPWYTERSDEGVLIHPALKVSAEREYLDLRKTYGEDSEELFEALQSRLSELPDFDRVLHAKEEKPKPAEKQPPKRPSRQNTAPSNKHGDDDSAGKMDRNGAPTLSDHDIAKLRALDLDPDDPKVRLAYMKYNPRKFAGARS